MYPDVPIYERRRAPSRPWTIGPSPPPATCGSAAPPPQGTELAPCPELPETRKAWFSARLPGAFEKNKFCWKGLERIKQGFKYLRLDQEKICSGFTGLACPEQRRGTEIRQRAAFIPSPSVTPSHRLLNGQRPLLRTKRPAVMHLSPSCWVFPLSGSQVKLKRGPIFWTKTAG